MRKLTLEELEVDSFVPMPELPGDAGTVEARGLRAGTLTHEGGPSCYPDSGCEGGCTLGEA